MEEFQIILKNFLYNSGVLGFYNILCNAKKESLVQIQSNTLKVKQQALENFEEDYFKAMMDTYKEDTKWYNIVNRKERLMQLELPKDTEELEYTLRIIKNAMESASYKSGYEILKEKSEKNPYEILQTIKKSNIEEKRKLLIEIINHIEQNKEIYCMKDIIYTKINCFWSNTAFLYRTANKKDMKQEYKKVFVTPAQNYIKTDKKNLYQCIECGNYIKKQEARGMSWLNDVGVDINKKKSGFWNFTEDMFICPICSLIYSCAPLGFSMIGSSGIFVNNNESFETMRLDNLKTEIQDLVNQGSIDSIYHKVIKNYINRLNQIGTYKKVEKEPKNIQVVKRVGEKNRQYYEFNIISKDKLEILNRVSNEFDQLVKTNLYGRVLTNLIQGTKQYNLINELLKNKDTKNVKAILKIESATMKGGIEMKERNECIEEMIKEGENLQIYFFNRKENRNKLDAFAFKLQNALKINSVEEFMKLFTLFYGSINEKMPNTEGMKRLIKNPEEFRLLGYAYVYGLGKIVDKRKEGEDKNEE